MRDILGKIFGIVILILILLTVFLQQQPKSVETYVLSFTVQKAGKNYSFEITLQNKTIEKIKMREGRKYVIIYPKNKTAIGTMCKVNNFYLSHLQCFERYERLVKDVESGLIYLDGWKKVRNETRKGLNTTLYQKGPAVAWVYKDFLIIDDNIATTSYPWKYAKQLNIT